MIANILKLADIFSKLAKVKQMIDFFRKNISQKTYNLVSALVLSALLFQNITIKNEILLLRKSYNQGTVARVVTETRFETKKEIEKQQQLNKDKVFVTYYKKSQDGSLVSILENIYCFKDDFVLEQHSCLNKDKVLLKPQLNIPLNATIGLERKSNTVQFSICSNLLKIFCNAFIYNENSLTLPLIRDIMNTDKQIYGYSCRLEGIQGVAFFDTTSINEICPFDEKINRPFCKDSVFLDKFGAIFNTWNVKCLEFLK